MMKYLGYCHAVLVPAKNLQSFITRVPLTFCGSLFDIRYSAQVVRVHFEGTEPGPDSILGVPVQSLVAFSVVV
jgi:hypothetical protein